MDLGAPFPWLDACNDCIGALEHWMLEEIKDRMPDGRHAYGCRDDGAYLDPVTQQGPVPAPPFNRQTSLIRLVDDGIAGGRHFSPFQSCDERGAGEVGSQCRLGIGGICSYDGKGHLADPGILVMQIVYRPVGRDTQHGPFLSIGKACRYDPWCLYQGPDGEGQVSDRVFGDAAIDRGDDMIASERYEVHASEWTGSEWPLRIVLDPAGCSSRGRLGRKGCKADGGQRHGRCRCHWVITRFTPEITGVA